jgi:hypothetical protein
MGKNNPKKNIKIICSEIFVHFVFSYKKHSLQLTFKSIKGNSQAALVCGWKALVGNDLLGISEA